MKMIIIIFFTCLMQVSANTLAQKITINQKNVSLESVLRQIRNQSGYNFLYGIEALKNTKPVTVSLKNATIEEALDAILKNQPLSYEFKDKTVIITEKEPSFLDRVIKSFKDIRISGQVVDEKGKGMPGATIKLKGNESTIPIVTSSDGNFGLTIPGENAVLIVSYVGYKTKEVNVSGADVDLVIRMEPIAGELEGVTIVSTGYQNLPKERSTGSFEKIDNALLNRSNGSSILSRLENVTPGLLIDRRQNPNGAPKIGEISIRGVSTLTQAIAAPLVILDNFPYPGQLENINPNDIESVTILKDAAASSIWGARAANGVIVINTKKGS